MIISDRQHTKKRSALSNTYRKQKKVSNIMYYITYDNETVVYDSSKKRLVSVPTEQEAIEYINDYSNNN